MVQIYAENPAAADEGAGIDLMQSFAASVDNFLDNAQTTLTETFHTVSEFFEKQAALAELTQAVEEFGQALDEHHTLFTEMVEKLEALFHEQELDQEITAMSDAELVAEFEAHGLASPEELAAIKAELGIEPTPTQDAPKFTEAEQALIDKTMQQDAVIDEALANGTPLQLSEIDPFLMSEEQIASLSALNPDLPAYKETLESLHGMTQDMLVQQGLEGGAPLTSLEDIQTSLEAASAAAQTYDPAADEGIFGISGIEELTSSENMHQYDQAFFALQQTNPEVADTLKTLLEANINNGMKRNLYEETGINYNDLSPVQRLQVDGTVGRSIAELDGITQSYIEDLQAQGLSMEQVRDKVLEEMQFTYDNDIPNKAMDARWDVTDNIQYGDGYGRILDEAAAELGDIPYEFMGHEDQVTNTLATVAEFGNHTPATFIRDMRGNLEGQGLPAEVVNRMEQQIQTYLGEDALNNQHIPIAPEDMADLLETIGDEVHYAGEAAREFLDTYDPQDGPDQDAGADLQDNPFVLDINGAPLEANTTPGFKP